MFKEYVQNVSKYKALIKKLDIKYPKMSDLKNTIKNREH